MTTAETALSAHPFDTAIALDRAAESPHHYRGVTSPAYWNMVGPFGGSTAATALQAVMLHPQRLGEPLALTVNYAAALAEGEFAIHARPVRTNRSTQHWLIEMTQVDAAGNSQLVLTATAVTAARRETWSQNDRPLPTVSAPEDTPEVILFAGSEWVRRYAIRPVRGGIPSVMDDSGDDSLSQFWLRDQPPRPLDFAALASMADAFFPRVWLRRARRVPAGTVSLTVYFHAGSAELAAHGSDFLLGQAEGQAFKNGFFDQAGHLWSRSGDLLATTHQMVYFKE